MWNTVLDAVGSAAFLPHGHCFLWTPALLWSYLIADTTIVISYYSIPLALVYFAIRRKDFGYRWLLWMFGAFIAACGTTHLLSIVTIWQPVYWLDAAVKGLTALVSLVTAIALWPAIPLLLGLPSPAQLRGLNQELEQKVAERQRAEQRFRRVVESSPYAMILVDAEGRIQMINTETELLFGYPRDTLLGQPLNRLIPERFHSSHDKLRLDFNRAPQTRPMGGGRALTGRRHDGAEFPVEIGLNAIDTEEGPATLATLVDITERKRIERALRDSEQRNRLVVDNAMDAIISMDMKGAITAWNARAETLFQWTAGDIIGHGVAKTLLPELAATALEELIAADGEQRSNRRVETVAQCRDGGRLPVEVSITPYELDGQRHFTAFVRDITERKKSDEEIQRHRDHLSELVDERTRDLQNAVDHAEKANRTKDDFLATMSHELRTPLNAILGLSESLLEQRVGALNERQLRAVTTIGSSGRHLLELINDILDLSKLSAGALVLEISAVAVKPLCDASLLFVKEAAAKKQIDLTASYDSAIGSIEADPRRLKQMLINLLTNAVKFTPSHGKIGLAVSGDRVNRTVNLTVWDTGIGMVKSDLGRLFKPFAQLDSALSRGFEGTGLGLALVMRMAEQHGGTVTVESEPGKGSRFTVVLPWIEAQTSGAAPDRRPRLAQTGDTGAMDERPKALPLILLAEDNETNILVIADYLEDKGYRVSLARNGVEALERTRSDRPDLILMDIQMPVMDGLEATRCLRLESNPDLARIPVVALTALAMPGDEQRCLAAGATEYLTKPVSFRDLLDAIKRLTETGA